MKGLVILAVYAVLRWEPKRKLDNVCFEYSSYMDLGTGTICINGKSVYKWVCRAFLVFGAECAMPDYFHTICKEDTKGNAGGNHTVWVYEG